MCFVTSMLVTCEVLHSREARIRFNSHSMLDSCALSCVGSYKMNSSLVVLFIAEGHAVRARSSLVEWRFAIFCCDVLSRMSVKVPD